MNPAETGRFKGRYIYGYEGPPIDGVSPRNPTQPPPPPSRPKLKDGFIVSLKESLVEVLEARREQIGTADLYRQLQRETEEEKEKERVEHEKLEKEREQEVGKKMEEYDEIVDEVKKFQIHRKYETAKKKFDEERRQRILSRQHGPPGADQRPVGFCALRNEYLGECDPNAYPQDRLADGTNANDFPEWRDAEYFGYSSTFPYKKMLPPINRGDNLPPPPAHYGQKGPRPPVPAHRSQHRQSNLGYPKMQGPPQGGPGMMQPPYGYPRMAGPPQGVPMQYPYGQYPPGTAYGPQQGHPPPDANWENASTIPQQQQQKQPADFYWDGYDANQLEEWWGGYPPQDEQEVPADQWGGDIYDYDSAQRPPTATSAEASRGLRGEDDSYLYAPTRSNSEERFICPPWAGESTIDVQVETSVQDLSDPNRVREPVEDFSSQVHRCDIEEEYFWLRMAEKNKEDDDGFRLKRVESLRRDAGVMVRPVGYIELDLNTEMAPPTEDQTTQVTERMLDREWAEIRGVELEHNNILWPTIGEFDIDKVSRRISDYISQCWTISPLWMYCVLPIQSFTDTLKTRVVYEVKFSTPTHEHPVPQATASVFFVLQFPVAANEEETVKVHYVIEGTRFPLVPGKLPFQDKWLWGVISDKLRFQRTIDF